MSENTNGLAPYQVNCTFRGNEIGKMVVMNAAYPADGAVSGDTVQFNNAELKQDVEQRNAQTGVIDQETGDTFSIAVDSGEGDAVAVAISDHDQKQDAAIDQDQDAANTNVQAVDQQNQSE
jgi:hypothetical protein